MFPTDLASFCVNVLHLKKRPLAKFHDISLGNYETLLLQDLVRVDELETGKNNCKKVKLKYYLELMNFEKKFNRYIFNS